MALWLQDLLAFSLGGLLIALVLLWRWRPLLRRLRQPMESRVAQAAPVRISMLDRPAGAPWHQTKAVEEARRLLEGQRFAWVADAIPSPIQSLNCCLLVDPEGNGAVIYDHRSLGVWVDLFVRYPERGGLTVSSGRVGQNLHPPPFSHKYDLPGVSVDDLYRAFQERLAILPADRRAALTRDTVLREFEKAYADEMDWRNAQGGPSLDEVRSISGEISVSDPGRSFSESQLEEAWKIGTVQAREGLMEGLQLRFGELLRCQGSPLRHSDLLIVHDRLDAGGLLASLTRFFDDEEWEATALPDACRELSPRRAMEALQGELPEGSRFTRVATLDFPLLADAYRGPAGGLAVDLFPHRHRRRQEPSSRSC
jgi:hypothetical protein